MFKHPLSFSNIFLILVNLVPLWGVWFEGWSAEEMFLVYCLESVVLGLFIIIKLAILGFAGKSYSPPPTKDNSQNFSPWVGIPFFMVHFGIFLFIQLSIFLSISGFGKQIGTENPFNFIFHIRRYLSENAQWVLLQFILTYALATTKDFILNGAYKTAPLTKVMFEPYLRIFVQQFTVILGSMFVGIAGGKVFMLVFVAIKIFFEFVVPFNKINTADDKDQLKEPA